MSKIGLWVEILQVCRRPYMFQTGSLTDVNVHILYLTEMQIHEQVIIILCNFGGTELIPTSRLQIKKCLVDFNFLFLVKFDVYISTEGSAFLVFIRTAIVLEWHLVWAKRISDALSVALFYVGKLWHLTHLFLAEIATITWAVCVFWSTHITSRHAQAQRTLLAVR